jgi:hypothetical protein
MVACLIFVVYFLERDNVCGEEMSQLGQEDAIAQTLFQLRGRGHVFVDACLDPSKTHKHFDMRLGGTWPSCEVC